MIPERWHQVKDVLEEALELSAPQREAFLDSACDGDQALRQEVESLLLEEKDGTEEFLRPPLDLVLEDAQRERASWAGHRIGSYEIIDIIGEGGMGSVYRAARADEQYQKQVAIKVVKLGLGTPFALARFRAERQILADLEHPNIARLLDGGTTEDGLPYVVMELVEGQRLDEYCDAHKLATTERLNLFLQICAAVQYAHQRLIIHRDIKPGNILVNAEGVPKLLDFGIAKILESNEAIKQPLQTISLVRLLTPEYASPEQIKGAAITTASDVYSLGVVLYELLTGRAPYNVPTHTPHELSRAVCETEAERPSVAVLRKLRPNKEETRPAHDSSLTATLEGSPERLSKRLSGDLDNIVLMALRKEPQRRYGSVEQFREDIRRHLENLPVIARKDTARYRMTKFIARHKVGVAATAIVVLTAAIGIAVIVHEARIAQRRFDDVRSLASSLIFEVHDAIRDLPGSTPARKLIVAKAVKYLDSLAQDAQSDPALQREVAAGYRRIGEVDASNLGDPAGALASFKKALAIRRTLVASRDGNLDDLVEFALLTRQVGGKTSLLGDLQHSTALDTYRQAAQMLETALAQHPNHIGIMRELMLNYSAQAQILAGGFALLHLGDTSAALQPSRRQLELSQRLCDLQPADLELRRDLADSFGILGDELYATGQDREAFEEYARAQKILGELMTQWPTPKARLSLYDSYYRMVPIKITQGDLGGATSDARQLVEISAKLSQDDPQNRVPRLLLAAAYAELGDTMSRSPNRNDHSEARSAMARALSIDEELIRTHANNPEFPDMQAMRFREAGDILRKIGDHEGALSYYRQAIAFFSAATLKDPTDAGRRHLLAGSYDGLGSALLALHRSKEAEGAFRKVLELNGSETDSGRKEEEALYQTADAYSGLAAGEAILGSDARLNRVQRIEHLLNARADYEQSLQVWSRVPRPRLLSPEGYGCTTPAVVTQRLAKVNSTLQWLHAGDPGPFLSATVPHDR
jgi:serine/threonine protein kinase/tetratricopeptide (TPR) repeat protein